MRLVTLTNHTGELTMRSLAAIVTVAALTALTGACTNADENKVSTTSTTADDKKGTVVEWVGMKSTAPGAWKEVTPSNNMRKAQFLAPKADGDKEDAEVVLFEFKGGGGVEPNLKRQVATFQPPAGKDKVEEKSEKLKIGGADAVYQQVSGTLLKKAAPFDPNAKSTPVSGYKQLYVVFEKDGITASVFLRGPEKTVELHRKAFEDWVKAFK
jgi:hypothetical protein